MPKSGKTYEDLMQEKLTGRCTGCGSEIELTLSAVVTAAERVTMCCWGCRMEQGVQAIAYLDALQVFAAWLQDNPHGDHVLDAQRKLQVLSFARFAFAHVVEEFRSHGGTDTLQSGLVQARLVLATATSAVAEPDCRLTLLLSGGDRDQVLAYYTRATMAFSAYSRYTRDLLEALVSTTNCFPKASTLRAETDAELAQAYDELCSGTYVELCEAIFALSVAPSFPPSPDIYSV